MKKIILFILIITILTNLTCSPKNPYEGTGENMGMGLYYVSYYDFLLPFMELTKQGSHWLSFDPDGSEWEDQRDIPFDQNGYPTSLESNQAARMIIFLGWRKEIAPSGEYTLIWEGSGTISVVMNEIETLEWTSTDARKQTFTFNPDEEENSLFIVIRETNPADYIKNIRLYAPGYDDTSTDIMSPHLNELLEPFSPIRFADWTMVNTDYSPSEWSERAKMDNYTWGDEFNPEFAQGVPYEMQLELVNKLDKDMWTNIPHRATDDFVRQLARMIRDNLDDGLHVYVEYTNEHWNYWFPQHDWMYQQSQNYTGDHPYEEYTMHHYFGKRTGEVCSIFHEEFTDDSRVRCVLSGQSGWSNPLELAAEEVDRLGYTELFYGAAIAPYWGNNEQEDLTQAMKDALPKPSESDFDKIFDELKKVIDQIYDPTAEYGSNMLANKKVADDRGWEFITYEAGQHIVSWHDESLGDIPTLINERPEMYDLYMHYLNGWRELTDGGLIVMFHLAGAWFGGECFGHLKDYKQPIEEAHKYRALVNWLK
jgi:hypothetical protein